ncbi:MAG: D-sedoheptulose 7-phosphate isomerase [Candidatus Omnitrophota bacterium]
MNRIMRASIENHRHALASLESNLAVIEAIASLFIEALRKKGKIIFMGNGGSAADAQHLAAEFVGRFKNNRIPLAALSLASNVSSLTAIGNDYGFDELFSRQVQALASEHDIVVGISTSGKSENVLRAIAAAKQLNIKTVGFLGRDGGALKEMVDIAFLVPSTDTPRVQEIHILAGHIICEIVEEAFL